MGKARILEAHGEGRYTIEIIEARERAEFAKQEAQRRIQKMQSEITILEQRIAFAQSAVYQAAAEQNAAISRYRDEIAETGESSVDLEASARRLLEAAGDRDALRNERRAKELRIFADTALVGRVNALPPLRQVQAWCADYTEDLGGEVATAEVPGEAGTVIISPGFEGNAWSATADGAMQPALASTPAATFYNLAMLPGWQKWRPTYRVATITSLDGDTCSISLDAATSSQQGLGVNAQNSYSGVPILYMDCDGAAFEVSDKVLVAFAGNAEGPTVVGFERAPQPCMGKLMIIIFNVHLPPIEEMLSLISSLFEQKAIPKTTHFKIFIIGRRYEKFSGDLILTSFWKSLSKVYSKDDFLLYDVMDDVRNFTGEWVIPSSDAIHSLSSEVSSEAAPVRYYERAKEEMPSSDIKTLFVHYSVATAAGAYVTLGENIDTLNSAGNLRWAGLDVPSGYDYDPTEPDDYENRTDIANYGGIKLNIGLAGGANMASLLTELTN